jgi:cytochrome c-type protein NapC
MRGWGSGPGSVAVLVAGLALGAVFFACRSFMVYANSEAFCATSCHEMTQLHKEHRGSAHDVNRSGVRATCNDCHVPHVYGPNYLAKLGLFSHVWGHFATRSLQGARRAGPAGAFLEGAPRPR